MEIKKQIKCNRCGHVVTDNVACVCGNVVLSNGNVTILEGVLGKDATDVSQKLLNE